MPFLHDVLELKFACVIFKDIRKCFEDTLEVFGGENDSFRINIVFCVMTSRYEFGKISLVFTQHINIFLAKI